MVVADEIMPGLGEAHVRSLPQKHGNSKKSLD